MVIYSVIYWVLDTRKESLKTWSEAECCWYFLECLEIFLSVENSVDHGYGYCLMFSKHDYCLLFLEHGYCLLFLEHGYCLLFLEHCYVQRDLLSFRYMKRKFKNTKWSWVLLIFSWVYRNISECRKLNRPQLRLLSIFLKNIFIVYCF